MKTYLLLKKAFRPERPEGFQSDSFADELVEIFLDEYTSEGDVVFDPFAGFGTTLTVAERMNRRPLGIEYLADRVEFTRNRLNDRQAIIHGDSRNLDDYDLPAIDFSITSPPYMHANDPEDPLAAYEREGGGYQAYLDGLTEIYRKFALKLKPGGVAVVNAMNIKRESLTVLAWDIAASIGRVLRFEGEVVVCWDQELGFGYDHDYCLVFRKVPA